MAARKEKDTCIYAKKQKRITHTQNTQRHDDMAMKQQIGDFMATGKAWITQAISKDNEGSYAEAKDCYLKGIDAYVMALKWEKSKPTKRVLSEAVEGYTKRAEVIAAILKSAKESSSPSPSSSNQKKVSAADAGGVGAAAAPTGDDGPMAQAMAKIPDVHWDDIAGLKEVKKLLQRSLLMPIQFPNLFAQENGRTPSRGILMYGPPGTGKTHLARAVATESKMPFFAIKCSSIVSKYVGDSEKAVRNLFDQARTMMPSILFIDEIDALASLRTANEQDSTRRLKNELFMQMEGVDNKDSNIYVIAATNLPLELDPAMLRRLPTMVYIPLPDKDARKALVHIHVKKMRHTLTDDDVSYVANATEGFSGSDITTMCREANLQPIARLQDATHFRLATTATTNNTDTGDNVLQGKEEGQEQTEYEPCLPTDDGATPLTLEDLRGKTIRDVPITIDDFKNALRTCKSTVAPADLKTFESFTALYGQVGS
jgi:vacuolar protein-sorting-associated protein 4